MGTVYLHELADQLRSLRFQVSLLVLLMFFVANGVIYSLKMAREVQETARIQADVEQRIEDAETIGDAATRWFQAVGSATGTEFITEGGFNWFSDARWMNTRSGWGVVVGERIRTTNHWIRRFEVVDWTVIVRLVVSFLCVVLAYDAISGGLERGTLRLALANPLPRGSLLAGRVLAHWTTLMVSVATGVAVSLLILVVQDVLRLDGDIAAAVAAFFVATGVYVAFYLLLATCVSAVARSSAASLVVMVLAWAVLTVVIPQTAYLVGSRAETLELNENAFDLAFAVLREHEEALEREGIHLRDPDVAAADNHRLERQYLTHMSEVENEQRRVVRESDDLRVRQYRAACLVNLVSPGYAYQYTVEGLLGTGLARRQDFIEQAWRYRDVLRDYIRTQDAADPDSPHLAFLGRYMSTKPFDGANLPRFRQQPMPRDRGLAASVVPVTVLCLETALAFFLAFGAFLRMDLSGNE